VKEGQRYINLNPGRLFVQQPPKRERDREAHLNYYAKINLNQAKQITQSDDSGRKGSDGQQKKISKVNEKRKKGKSNKEQKMRK